MNIDRVSVDLGNPISGTTAGRYELMQQMMQFGVLKSPNQITAFLKSGEIDSTLEDSFKDTLTIREENEMLRRGQKPTIMITDFHPQHIEQHKQIFSDPIMREDPELMKVAIEHMVDHGELWSELFDLYPEIAAALNIPPPPGFQPPMPGEEPGQEMVDMDVNLQEMPEEASEPAIEGTKMPSLPDAAPSSAQENYNQALSQVRKQNPDQS